MTVCTTAWLLLGVKSAASLDTVAWLARTPASGAATTKLNVAVAPGGSDAMVSVIWLPLFVKVNAGPDVWVWETNIVRAGSKSLSTTLSAALGPRLLTVTV